MGRGARVLRNRFSGWKLVPICVRRFNIFRKISFLLVLCMCMILSGPGRPAHVNSCSPVLGSGLVSCHHRDMMAGVYPYSTHLLSSLNSGCNLTRGSSQLVYQLLIVSAQSYIRVTLHTQSNQFMEDALWHQLLSIAIEALDRM